MLTAREWHWEQLLKAREKHDLKNRRHCQLSMLPLAQCHPLISDSAISALAQENIAMATSLQPPHLSLLLSLPSPSPNRPLAPTPWRTFTSLVKKPCPWQTQLPMPSKSIMKIPLKYCLPTQKDNKLPKGWTYDVGEVKEEDHTDPSPYTKPDQPLTHAMCNKAVKHRIDPYCHLCKGTNAT
jgi:hypothetical protein